MSSLPSSNDNIAGNKIKGDNNKIIIKTPQIPSTECSEIIQARERELNQLRVENEMLRIHIEHLAKDVSRVRNILNEKDKYIAALIATKTTPKPPPNN